MRIHKSFVPSPLVLVLNLDDMGESDRAVGFRQVFQRGRVVIIFTTERLFSFLEDIFNIDSWLRGCDIGYVDCELVFEKIGKEIALTFFYERRPE